MSDDRMKFNLAVAGLVLLLTVSVGYGIVTSNREAGEQLIEFVRSELYAGLLGDDPFIIFIRIFLNNLEACALLFLGGTSLGLFTVLIISLNGLLIGGVIAFSVHERGPLFIMAALLPHGLLEIPAFLLSGALGLSLAQALWMEVRGAGDASESAERLGRIFISIVIPLVAIAAFIESFITPYVLDLII
ncbi:MAG: stage II sporulation protein M [Methanomicrobiales archaeon]|nr:stage II sporulation protein M [Methanomicrobiales archaeon]